MLKKFKSVLITGGTGSFGKSITKYLLKNYSNLKKIVIFSRDELKQFEMSKSFSSKETNKMRFFIGDVRDKARLEMALEEIDVVIHAAALKQVPAAEYNPFEFIKTNILGAQNLIEASIKNNVKSVVALSTDKAAGPVNLYGATKLASDKLFVAANNTKGKKKINFSVVRYGNVLGSRGSILPLFKDLSNKNKDITITHENMTRFNIEMLDALKMVIWAIDNSKGGEIFVPKLKSFNIIDFASSLSPKSKIQISGIRPGEKMHEEMITESDGLNTFDLGKYYAIVSNLNIKTYNYYTRNKKAKKLNYGFSLNSKDSSRLSKKEIKKILKKFN
tara:strand:+ start:56 stop:1051 length:996 start_codon:yes stop_codon:yes gene_type:complete